MSCTKMEGGGGQKICVIARGGGRFKEKEIFDDQGGSVRQKVILQ